jgi:hypothetical protein
MFDKTLITLGTISHNDEQTVTFHYDNIHEIVSIVTSCGCSRAYNKISEKALIIIYTPNPVPPHLKNVGRYFVKKEVYVIYKTEVNGPDIRVTLTFNATVI